MLTLPRTDSVSRFEVVPEFDWEETVCPSCGKDHSQPIFEAADPEPKNAGLRFAIVECADCGLWFTNPRPSPADIGKFYPSDYLPYARPQLRPAKNSWLFRMQSRLLGRPCRERQYLPWHGQGRLLDFGCGGGEYLIRMQNQGWKTTALDVSENVIQNLQAGFGIKGYVGTLPHPELKPASFDVVTMWASLEHVHQPLETLRGVHRILAPGGRVYVQVPNSEGWECRLFGENSFSWDVPRHLTFFCPRTLNDILGRAGFQVQTIRQVSQPSWSRKSLKRARQAGTAGFFSRLLALKAAALARSWLGYLCGKSENIFAFAERE